jgi:uncharacterized protein with FMN-binding domain
MRRAIVVSTATVSGVVLLLGLKSHSADAVGSSPIGLAASSAPSSTASTAASSAAKTVTGDAVDTRYGPIQVQVTMSGKKITNIEVLEYPTDSPRDQEINSYAVPELNSEAMSAQSAQIDVVSGATYTSDGYMQSLQSALDNAGA